MAEMGIQRQEPRTPNGILCCLDIRPRVVRRKSKKLGARAVVNRVSEAKGARGNVDPADVRCKQEKMTAEEAEDDLTSRHREAREGT